MKWLTQAGRVGSIELLGALLVVQSGMGLGSRPSEDKDGDEYDRIENKTYCTLAVDILHLAVPTEEKEQCGDDGRRDNRRTPPSLA